MTVSEWCVLAAVLIYLLTIAPFKPLGWREFDNQNPRDPKFYPPALRNRALGAHNNGIETFPFFAFAVFLVEFRHVPQSAGPAHTRFARRSEPLRLRQTLSEELILFVGLVLFGPRLGRSGA